MKIAKIALALLTTLALSSCGAVKDTVDHTADRAEDLISHTTEELGKLRTETLHEVRDTIEKVVPDIVDKAVERILGDEAVAFLIVSVTFLLSLVVIVALVILIGTTRVWWRRLRSHSKIQLTNKTNTGT